MSLRRYMVTAALVAAGSSYSDTLFLKDGTALDGEVSQPHPNCYVLTVGATRVTFAAEGVDRVEKNDKKGHYDFAAMNPLAVKHQREMQRLTGLTEEQREAIQAMFVPLGSDDPVVRSDAIQALIKKGADIPITKFVQMSAAASSPATATGLLEVLVALDPKAARVTLMERATDMEPEIRGRTIELLGTLRDSGSLKIIAAGLKDHDVSVQIAAARGLGNAGDKRATSVLVEQLDSPHPEVRNASIAALQRIWADTSEMKGASSVEAWKQHWTDHARHVPEAVQGENLAPLVEAPEGGAVIRG